MAQNGSVRGSLVVDIGMNSSAFTQSLSGVNKGIRNLKANLNTIDKYFKATGDEIGGLNTKIKQSENLMGMYKERIKQAEAAMKGLKPNTQDFVKYQTTINRTQAEIAELESKMKSYRKQLLYTDAEMAKSNAKHKAQAQAISSVIKKYEAEGNALKKSKAERLGVRNSIQQTNKQLQGEQRILAKVKDALGATSNEYKEQSAKISNMKNQLATLNAEYKRAGNAVKVAAVNQRAMNSSFGRSLMYMKDNRAGLTDLRNSFMGMTAVATGAVYPIARALGGAVKATINWEDAQANVAKTTNASKAEMADYSKSIRDMAKEMPESQSDIANTMAMAAQLGVKNLKGFTRVATQMSVATDMTAEEAATNMARFANATGKPDSDFKKLGSTVVQLGNNMAAQESEIMNFAQRLAGTGTVVGVSQKDIMALSGAMASVGINAESGECFATAL